MNAIFLGTEEDSLCLLLTQGKQLTASHRSHARHPATLLYFLLLDLFVFCFVLFRFLFWLFPFLQRQDFGTMVTETTTVSSSLFLSSGDSLEHFTMKRQLLTQAEEHYSHLLIFSMNTG